MVENKINGNIENIDKEKKLNEKILNSNKEYFTSSNKIDQSNIEKDIEIKKLKKELNKIEKTEIKIENIHKEIDNHILEKDILDKSLNELKK